MITLGNNEEKKVLAEGILTEVWLEALDRTTQTPEFANVKKEVEKIIKEIKKSKCVKNITIKTACIILQISCTSPSDMLNIISYFESIEFHKTLVHISKELGYYFNTSLSVYSVIPIECLMGVLNCQNEPAQPEQSGIRIPIAVSSPAGMLQLRSLFNSEKIVNSTNAISDALSTHLDETITLNVCADMKVFSSVFDEDKPQKQDMPQTEDNPHGQDDSAPEEEKEMARQTEAEEMVDAIKSGPGIDVDEIKRTAAEGGAHKVKEYVNAKLDEWKTIPLHVGVIGNSGVGKSSFINALRDVKKGQKGYAEVDVMETTTELTPYSHPQNESLVFWDMPGVGTQKYPQGEYLEKVKFTSYDFLLILTCTRFTENDLWLAREAQKENKAFYFIRTKIDLDVLNDKMDDPDNHTEEAVVTRIRESSKQHLQKENIDTDRLFLISNKGKLQKSYDFRKLVNSLLEVPKRLYSQKGMLFEEESC